MEHKVIILADGALVKVGVEDYDYLSQFNWHRIDTHYAKRAIYHPTRPSIMQMHREVALRAGYSLASQIDHKNTDDEIYSNERTNLRAATASQNAANRRKSLNCSSAYKGVTYKKGKGIFRAYIMIDGSEKHLGYYKNEEDAARAYNVAALRYFKEFARLNEV